MTENTTREEVLVGLNVLDDELYRRYREAMTPILERHGGFFRHDFRVAEVLRTQVQHEVNRLFVISFPNAEARRRFFENEEYLAARRDYFDPSVGDHTILAEYGAPGDL